MKKLLLMSLVIVAGALTACAPSPTRTPTADARSLDYWKGTLVYDATNRSKPVTFLFLDGHYLTGQGYTWDEAGEIDYSGTIIEGTARGRTPASWSIYTQTRPTIRFDFTGTFSGDAFVGRFRHSTNVETRTGDVTLRKTDPRQDN